MSDDGPDPVATPPAPASPPRARRKASHPTGIAAPRPAPAGAAPQNATPTCAGQSPTTVLAVTTHSKAARERPLRGSPTAMDDDPRGGRLLPSSIVSHSATSICDQRNLFHSPCDPSLTVPVLRSLSTERTPTSRELDALCVERPVGPQATGPARPRLVQAENERPKSIPPLCEEGGENFSPVVLAKRQRRVCTGFVPEHHRPEVRRASSPEPFPSVPWKAGCSRPREARRSSVCSRGRW